MGGIVLNAKVIGGERVLGRFGVIIPEEVRTRIGNEVRSLGLTLERKVKLEKLEGQVLHRRSGRLVRSINTKYRETELTFTSSVGTNLVYGRAWELGFHGTVNVQAFTRKTKSGGEATVRAHQRTMNMDPRPFLRPSLDEMRLTIRQRLQLAMKDL